MIEFKLNIKHKAENEEGLLEWLVYIRDNHATSVIDGSIQSATLQCFVTLQLPTLAEAVTTIKGFRAQFSIDYGLVLVLV